MPCPVPSPRRHSCHLVPTDRRTGRATRTRTVIAAANASCASHRRYASGAATVYRSVASDCFLSPTEFRQNRHRSLGCEATMGPKCDQQMNIASPGLRLDDHQHPNVSHSPLWRTSAANLTRHRRASSEATDRSAASWRRLRSSPIEVALANANATAANDSGCLVVQDRRLMKKCLSVTTRPRSCRAANVACPEATDRRRHGDRLAATVRRAAAPSRIEEPMTHEERSNVDAAQTGIHCPTSAVVHHAPRETVGPSIRCAPADHAVVRGECTVRSAWRRQRPQPTTTDSDSAIRDGRRLPMLRQSRLLLGERPLLVHLQRKLVIGIGDKTPTTSMADHPGRPVKDHARRRWRTAADRLRRRSTPMRCEHDVHPREEGDSHPGRD